MRAADCVALQTADAVAGLLAGIKKLRAIRIDIFYMALNTNLPCSRLGRQGLTLNVVTAELRNQAENLESDVETMSGDLERLDVCAAELSHKRAQAVDLSETLADVRGTITTANDRMQSQLQSVVTAGRQMHEQVSRTAGDLDFEAELGDVLRACLVHIASTGQPAPRLANAAEKAAADLAAVFAVYTMECERHDPCRPLWSAGRPGRRLQARNTGYGCRCPVRCHAVLN